MRIKSVHNEIFIFDSSKMLKVKNKHFKAKSIAECPLPFVIKIFVLSIFEWPLKTGFTGVVICVSHWSLIILTTVRVKNILYMLLFLHAKFTTIILMYTNCLLIPNS